ncbi:hypothetical protein PENSPDRAFT_657135 [Peniophora sp. CONT]|nr:hypothetical protein PENSPDRAFT_657135 [Peniophora sp. CONT]
MICSKLNWSEVQPDSNGKIGRCTAGEGEKLGDDLRKHRERCRDQEIWVQRCLDPSSTHQYPFQACRHQVLARARPKCRTLRFNLKTNLFDCGGSDSILESAGAQISFQPQGALSHQCGGRLSQHLMPTIWLHITCPLALNPAVCPLVHCGLHLARSAQGKRPSFGLPQIQMPQVDDRVCSRNVRHQNGMSGALNASWNNLFS